MTPDIKQYDFDGNLVAPEQPRLVEATYTSLVQEFDKPSATEVALFAPGSSRQIGLILRDRDASGTVEDLIISGITPKRYLSTSQIIFSHFASENRYSLATVRLGSGFSRRTGHIPFFTANESSQENWRGLLLDIARAQPNSDIRRDFEYKTHPTSEVRKLLQRVLNVRLNPLIR